MFWFKTVHTSQPAIPWLEVDGRRSPSDMEIHTERLNIECVMSPDPSDSLQQNMHSDDWFSWMLIPAGSWTCYCTCRPHRAARLPAPPETNWEYRRLACGSRRLEHHYRWEHLQTTTQMFTACTEQMCKCNSSAQTSIRVPKQMHILMHWEWSYIYPQWIAEFELCWLDGEAGRGCGVGERDEWAEKQSSRRTVNDVLNSLLLPRLLTLATFN